MESNEPNPYEGKKIVLRSIGLQVIWLACMVIAGVIALVSKTYVMGVICLIIAAWVLRQLTNPNSLFLAEGSQAYKDYYAYMEKQWLDDAGQFTYSDKGFTITINDTEKQFGWSDVVLMLGYKAHTHTDLTAVQVTINSGYKFRMTDDTPGWFLFVKQFEDQFDIPHNDWQEELLPAKSENQLFPIILYDRLDREPKEALAGFDVQLDDHDDTGFRDNSGAEKID